ncbi:MAG: hypothetical protein R3195_18840 [Gemmatimonadota bacterium]|nr:hypothetical protein [Gemmatimonadota bacterium]
MKEWFRRLRGAIGMGVTWAVGWAPVGAITGWVTGLVFGFPLAAVTINYTMMFGVLGFLGGTIFSGVLRLTEGSRRFEELTFPRFVGWGALGGFVLGGLAVSLGLLGSGLSVLGIVMASVATLLGAGSAAGALAIARAGEDPSLLKGDDDAPDGRLRGDAVPRVTGGSG